MTGSLLMDFLIACVGLALIVALFFLAIDRIAPDPFFNKVARYAVGGVALLAFLVAVKSVLFGGAGGMSVTPYGIIQFAIGLLVVMVVLYLIYLVIDKIAPPEFAAPVKYVIGAIALIALLVLAAQVLFGGGLGNFGSPASRQRTSQIEPLPPFPPGPAAICRNC